MSIPEPVVLLLAWSGLVAWSYAAVWLLWRYRLGRLIIEDIDHRRREEVEI